MSDTLFAWLTPSGTGAIATVVVHGPQAWNVCRGLFTPTVGELPEHPEQVVAGHFFLGQLGETMHDEAILALCQTEPPSVELHCHGGRQMLDMLRELFQSRGLREVSWHDWHHQCAATSVRAHAAVQLAHASTRRTAEILLDQYHGAFDDAITAIVAQFDKSDFKQAQQGIEELVRHSRLGVHLTTPWKIAIAGAPNVGKSSLVNALAGFQRCVVSEIPGTTRDVVTTRLAMEGWPVELCDTAGLRQPGESLEEAGIELARQAIAEADLCLWVLDASTPPVWPDALTAPLLHVINKSDLPATWNAESGVRVSAKTGAGLDELCNAILQHLMPDTPAPGAAMPITVDWCHRLDEVQRLCHEGQFDVAASLLKSAP